MAYKLIITNRADELLERSIYHIINNFKNEQAAKHLLNEIDKLYDRMEENPFQFPDCRDPYLKSKGYKETVVSGMDYIIVFRIEEEEVRVLGIFHQLENYKEKL